ncbi:hypothetical protein [Companilactobacillus hulinensis]|uniref:hypothetical protein n=1 Tax=Companilactobacillus hulinensis TaxID=2486007 RepID=UPI000F7665CD|nr:hypothetical protein [Companilactobacillus hulinensis]
MKIKSLFSNFVNLILQDFLYPTLLMSFLAVELGMNLLLNLDMDKKFGFLVIGIFLLSLLTSMNFLRNDSKQNRYFLQKINNYWLYFFMQALVLFLMVIFSALVIALFSLILGSNAIVDLVAILSLATTGFVGVGIAFICKPQWNGHPYAGQMGIIILVYISLIGSSIDLLHYIEWFLPPVSQMITIFQEQSSVRALLPVAIQQFVYSCVLIILSGTFYEKKMSN